jgi:hypothetical protein
MKTLKNLLKVKLMNIKDLNIDTLLTVSFCLIVVVILLVASFGSYLNYLSGKETRDLIREAISKNMTVESINYLVK